MAHTTESANLVWQKVTAALRDANPAIQAQFLQLKAYLAQARSNPNLKFTPIDGTSNGSDGGNVVTVLSDTASKYLVALYVKKGTGAVLAFHTVSNSASAATAQKEAIITGTTAGQLGVLIFPRGLLFATGITFSSVTAYNGTTQSLIADSASGFALTADAV